LLDWRPVAFVSALLIAGTALGVRGSFSKKWETLASLTLPYSGKV